ncbi:hypothetical protein [Actinacidiphila oryziradicis]|uniref:Uncharacterized protein n=1 Tax=Actinacidiphila oryziradicis TaxID=2571141 RepID=A0A4U0RUL6_9ACTN|nr:hypothetical protein [Actinacidiphila oryziradicis]TJZ99903.1 hypothetical protein FCI23_44195 [Actinacidiphila oryziradicis]
MGPGGRTVGDWQQRGGHVLHPARHPRRAARYGNRELLSLSAVLAITIRLAAGAFTDRAPRRNPAIGWGWGPDCWLATALRLVPGRAENAGHIVQVGVYAGATIAPVAFSALSSALGLSFLAHRRRSRVRRSRATTVGTLLLRRPR